VSWRLRVPILTYHSLDDSGSVVSVAPESFRAQMDALARWGYAAIGLGELLDLWDGGAEPERRPVVITFDDGFADLLDYALPVLAEHGFSATVFAVSAYCGSTNDWPSQPAHIPRLPLMTAGQLREMAAGGIEIGAHSVHHVPLDHLGPNEAEEEIVRSGSMLEDATGAAVRTFCYPYGRAGAAVRRTVATHYDGAVSSRLGTADVRCDRHWLPRIEMHYLRSPGLFRLYHGPLGGAYLGLRAIGRACRSALVPRFQGRRAAARGGQP
jgi:peptidoglycan/xylan/chitin deacetylase (PgdA/CDA1 family)